MLPYFSSSKLRIFQRASRGFTIIELLAAITLVSIIMFVVVTFVDVSRQSINHSQSRLDSASLATRVFERIHLDLANMVRRDDVANTTSNAVDESFLILLSETTNESSATGATFFPASAGEPAVIHYRLIAHPGTLQPELAQRPVLVRSAVGAYSTPSMGMGMDATANPVSIPSPLNTGNLEGGGDFDILAEGVIRVSVSHFNGTNYQQASGSNLINHSNLVITLAILDPKLMDRVDSTTLWNIEAALTSPPSGTNPIEHWQQEWSNGGPSGIPEYLWNGLRFYQREYPLP